MGSVRTPIIGRPRHLPRQRCADHLYTPICEEPVSVEARTGAVGSGTPLKTSSQSRLMTSVGRTFQPDGMARRRKLLLSAVFALVNRSSSATRSWDIVRTDDVPGDSQDVIFDGESLKTSLAQDRRDRCVQTALRGPDKNGDDRSLRTVHTAIRRRILSRRHQPASGREPRRSPGLLLASSEFCWEAPVFTISTSAGRDAASSRSSSLS